MPCQNVGQIGMERGCQSIDRPCDVRVRPMVRYDDRLARLPIRMGTHQLGFQPFALRDMKIAQILRRDALIDCRAQQGFEAVSRLGRLARNLPMIVHDPLRDHHPIGPVPKELVVRPQCRAVDPRGAVTEGLPLNEMRALPCCVGRHIGLGLQGASVVVVIAGKRVDAIRSDVGGEEIDRHKPVVRRPVDQVAGDNHGVWVRPKKVLDPRVHQWIALCPSPMIKMQIGKDEDLAGVIRDDDISHMSDPFHRLRQGVGLPVGYRCRV
ncbi:hypothetical protein PARPLA_01543 [Rhodobacteraceae bacterium THAF1]|nr:hypothetical protein FIU81_02540 [Palleronia sp. THAF1]VDC22898.1 hypothetical protein PARPLA_01543 [Rhodobacteraceae bacterium THAF1]